MNLRPRRRLAAATALAALVTLSACASQAADPAPPVQSSTPSATASATPTPTLSPAEMTAAFCKAVVGLDTAMLHLGPPSDSSATASPEPSSSSSMHHDMGSSGSSSSSDSSSSTSMPTPMYTAASVSTATPDPTSAAGPPPAPDLAEVMTPAIEALATAPRIDAVASDVDSMVSLLRRAVDTKDRNLFDSEDYAKAGAGVDKWMLSNCGYGKLAASAIDFEYDGLPKTLEGGANSISLTNDGKELHEIVLFRINDDVTTSFDDLLKLPEGEADSKVVPMGVVVVPPGQTGTSFFELPAGRYGLACFIPKGTKNGKEGDGPPHFTEGMVADLTVT